MDSYVDKCLKSGTTFLKRWQKSKVKVWEYSISHIHITFRLEKEDVKGNLHIVCVVPVFFSGGFRWENCDFELSFNEERNLFELKDVNSNYFILCEHINFYENCEPIF